MSTPTRLHREQEAVVNTAREPEAAGPVTDAPVRAGKRPRFGPARIKVLAAQLGIVVVLLGSWE
jgi:hypothetical protein